MMRRAEEKKARTGAFLDQEGSVLVVALMMLVLLTIMGVSATTTSDIEVQVAGNERFYKVAFYNADSGIYTTPKLISLCLDNGAEQTVSAISYQGTAGTFYREIMGYDAHDSTSDIRFTFGNHSVDVDVARTSASNIAGGGVEFASGAEGIGVGSAGGVAIFYDMLSQGTGPNSSLVELDAVYRKVLGVAGGL